MKTIMQNSTCVYFDMNHVITENSMASGLPEYFGIPNDCYFKVNGEVKTAPHVYFIGIKKSDLF